MSRLPCQAPVPAMPRSIHKAGPYGLALSHSAEDLPTHRPTKQEECFLQSRQEQTKLLRFALRRAKSCGGSDSQDQFRGWSWVPIKKSIWLPGPICFAVIRRCPAPGSVWGRPVSRIHRVHAARSGWEESLWTSYPGKWLLSASAKALAPRLRILPETASMERWPTELRGLRARMETACPLTALTTKSYYRQRWTSPRYPLRSKHG